MGLTPRASVRSICESARPDLRGESTSRRSSYGQVTPASSSGGTRYSEDTGPIGRQWLASQADGGQIARDAPSYAADLRKPGRRRHQARGVTSQSRRPNRRALTEWSLPGRGMHDDANEHRGVTEPLLRVGRPRRQSVSPDAQVWSKPSPQGNNHPGFHAKASRDGSLTWKPGCPVEWVSPSGRRISWRAPGSKRRSGSIPRGPPRRHGLIAVSPRARPGWAIRAACLAERAATAERARERREPTKVTGSHGRMPKSRLDNRPPSARRPRCRGGRRRRAGQIMKMRRMTSSTRAPSACAPFLRRRSERPAIRP